MKTISFTIVTLFSLVVLFSSASMAGERFGLQGHVELGGSVDFTNISQSQTSGSISVFSISPFMGYFVSNGFEIGIRPFVTVESPSQGNSLTQLAFFLAPAYNFHLNKSTLTPFLEGLAGYSSIDIAAASSTTSGTTVSGFAYGGRGGVKVQISDFGLLNVGIQYISVDRTPDKSPSTNRENRFSVSMGFSVFAY